MGNIFRIDNKSAIADNVDNIRVPTLYNQSFTGKGKIIIRAKTHIEEKGDKKSIVITEVPYQTNKAAILQKIAELREENKNILSGIVEIRDESDRTGMRAVIRLKKSFIRSKSLWIKLILLTSCANAVSTNFYKDLTALVKLSLLICLKTSFCME